MNKIQLIISWATGLLISAVMLFTPKITTWKEGLLILRKDQGFLAPLVNWSLVAAQSLVILIVGILLLYTFKDNKKK